MQIQDMAKKLKREFFGIDKIIDDVCGAMHPWSKMPESYTRPLIANLWGMTGTGKTTLVRRIAEMIKIPIIEIDVGSLASDNGSTYDFASMFFFKYFDLSGKPCIILLDELHTCTTLEKGSTKERGKMRSLWSLLSDGKMVVNARSSMQDDEYIFDEAEEEYRRDQKFIIKHKDTKDEDKQKEVKEVRKRTSDWYIGRWTIKYVCKAMCLSYKDVRKGLRKDFIKTLDMLRKKTKNISLQPKMDFTQAAIFVTGNLDDMYPSTFDFDPDADLEGMHKRSLDLTVSDVKDALSKSFRAEQIGRLGNNHFIYPSLNKEAYMKIARHDVNRITSYYRRLKNHPLRLSFDKTVHDVIYAEGVVPSQGARSVLSTIGSLIEPILIQYYIDHHEKINGDKTIFHYDKKKKDFIFKIDGEIIAVYKAKIILSELRKPIFTERSVHTAVHEAGHVLASVVFHNIIPNRVSAYTISSYNNGIMEFVLSREGYVSNIDNIKNYIRTCVAGLVAERFVFGDDKDATGTYGDMKAATFKALHLVDNMGYKTDLTHKTKSMEGDYNCFGTRGEKESKVASQIIEDAAKDVKESLEQYRGFFEDLIKEILENSMILKNDIVKIMDRNEIVIDEGFSYRKSVKEFFSSDNALSLEFTESKTAVSV